MRSTQNWQTLRLERFGLPASLRSDMVRGLLQHGLGSERDVVGVHVADARPGAGVIGQRGHLLVAHAAALAGAGAPAVQELDVVGAPLGGPPLLAVLALPRAGLQAALDVHQRAL